jgi:hypothetical protein
MALNVESQRLKTLHLLDFAESIINDKKRDGQWCARFAATKVRSRSRTTTSLPSRARRQAVLSPAVVSPAIPRAYDADIRL